MLSLEQGNWGTTGSQFEEVETSKEKEVREGKDWNHLG